MRISLIVAASANNVIGTRGGLPWHLPNDFKYFKALTMGKPIIMGRRTWASIGKALPGRQNIVLTRNEDFEAEGADIVVTPEAAIKLAGDVEELMVIGGGQVYELFMPGATRIYLTRVEAEIEGDTHFAPPDEGDWFLSASERHNADDRHAYDYEFRVYDRH